MSNMERVFPNMKAIMITSNEPEESTPASNIHISVRNAMNIPMSVLVLGLKQWQTLCAHLPATL